MTGVIAWEDPPHRRGAAVHDWGEIAADLQAKPGKWGRIAACASWAIATSTARCIRESQYEPLQGGKYEAVSRTVDGEPRIYVKFCGYEPDAGPPAAAHITAAELTTP